MSDEFHLPIEDWIDLHPFAPGEIPEVVRAYLDEAVTRGFHRVRLVHGRGIGVQREAVRRILASHPAVREFTDAPPAAGGWGATIAVLGEGPPTAPCAATGGGQERDGEDPMDDKDPVEDGIPWIGIGLLLLALLLSLGFLAAVARSLLGG